MILVIIETVAIRAIIVLALLCGLWSGGGGRGYDGILDIVVFVDWGRGWRGLGRRSRTPCLGLVVGWFVCIGFRFDSRETDMGMKPCIVVLTQGFFRVCGL